MYIYFIVVLCMLCTISSSPTKRIYSPCVEASICAHFKKENICGLQVRTNEVRRFFDQCDLKEFNCEYKTSREVESLDNRQTPISHQYYNNYQLDMSFTTVSVFILMCCVLVWSHGPPQERDNEDISMGRKMGAKWCNMAKVCNHDRIPVCGISHAGDVMGFRDLCDMFDFNCIRRRNYKQTACPGDKSVLTVSRRPTNVYYDE